MGPKPVTKQAKLSYQPILVSWENWQTQVYAGRTIDPTIHIVNDDNGFNDLNNAKFVYPITDNGQLAISSDTIALPPIPYYTTWQQKLSIKLPAQLKMGNYQLVGKIIKNGRVISENHDKLFIGNKEWMSSAAIPSHKRLLYDPAGKTKSGSFDKLPVRYQTVSSLKNIPATALLIIGENAANNGMIEQQSSIKQFIKNGGRVLCLRQDESIFP